MSREHLVEVIAGSRSDEGKKAIEPCLDTLKAMGISYRYSVLSADRHKDELAGMIDDMPDIVKVIICFAGQAAILPGRCEQLTKRRLIIGVPMDEVALTTMTGAPAGVGFTCTGLGPKGGGLNAAIIAAKVLGLHDVQYRHALLNFLETFKKEKPAEIDTQPLAEKGK